MESGIMNKYLYLLLIINIFSKCLRCYLLLFINQLILINSFKVGF